MWLILQLKVTHKDKMKVSELRSHAVWVEKALSLLMQLLPKGLSSPPMDLSTVRAVFWLILVVNLVGLRNI